MKGYKGFEKGLICKGKQYAENTVFEEENAKICESGMHFCELPHVVFEHYSAGDNHEFAEVEALDEAYTDDNRKYCTKKLRVGAKVNVFDICRISVSAFFEKFDFEKKIKEAKKSTNNNAGDCGAANAGDCGAANAGDWGAANAGNCGAANAGDRGAANAGDCGAANAGDWGAANAGNCGAANAGNCGAANAGYRGAANAGNWGAANAGYRGAANAGNWGAAIVKKEGKASVGKNGIAVAFGTGAKAKGKKGSALVLVEFDNENENIIKAETIIVDGTNIKEDVFYTLENGVLKVWEESENE